MILKEELYIVYTALLLLIGFGVLVKAYRKGFLFQILDVIWTIVSISTAFSLNRSLASQYPIYQDSILVGYFLNPILWFLIIFIILRILFGIIERLIRKMTKGRVIGTINRMLGLMVGMIKVALIYALVCTLCATPLVQNGSHYIYHSPLKYIDSMGWNLKDVMSFDAK